MAGAKVSSGGRRRSDAAAILEQLADFRATGGDGTLDFAHGASLRVLQYYTAVSPMLLPLIRDRPLILKRYPDGIAGGSFFQQNAGANTPRGVRVAKVSTDPGTRASRIIGGDLLTLLYIVQVGTIAVHAWQSRLQDLRHADSATIDLDPGPDVPFSSVVRLALCVKDELDALQLRAAVKTSGSKGIHIVLPLPPKIEFDRARDVSQRIAERVVERHPDLATVERRLDARPSGTIYVDAQQNAEGKSVVVAYSVRERTGATVSAPIQWREVRSTLRLQSFTVKTMPARLRKVGDVWADALKRPNTERAIDRALRDQ